MILYRLTGFAPVPAYTKTTSSVRLAYSGFRLLTALFFIHMCRLPEACRRVRLA